ncbi:MAG: RidA family protein [Pseudomonadota bacterium]
MLTTLSPVEIAERNHCTIALRRVVGPDALELFFSCQPHAKLKSPEEQAESAYHAIIETLHKEGGDFGSLVSETLFVKDIKSNIVKVHQGKTRALHAFDTDVEAGVASTEVEQTPLGSTAYLEILAHAVMPKSTTAALTRVNPSANYSRDTLSSPHGMKVSFEAENRFYAGGIYGPPGNAYVQTHGMFEAAEHLLQQAEMTFSDVMRTWIYLSDMERDYAGFNKARREFFQARKIDPIPASTGIGAPLAPAHADLCLGIYALHAQRDSLRTVMTTPTLNEAPDYGSDFSRGMRVEESNKTSLFVSGTASLDESGATVHLNDINAQVDRMLLNVAALLKGQGANFSDVVSAMTYVKRPEDAELVRNKLRDAGYENFPHVLVEAPVCRPELLCETEVIAVLSR